ncbi:ethanolamine utilization microcompartment protein EutL [Neobacillus vireti]|uniref:Ethanolamine utilization protein EutL n=1 Tax=Neobacillus vireti LMG 21834 TaxID=1131730 RepID=A0AB94IPZ4_9BACI|nr:ethanolamine utilization microcompartment protein EutL [Neobacillus vireti]ETI69140.1 ethanolamine utilization protein EutL [Neobacillus vireti LMG 21834]KLT15598.1 ethanolamine utilization protein EutL [Neobacillus vireti]
MDVKRVPAFALASQIIPNIDDGLREALQVPANIKSLGLVTSTSDDVGYTSLDEATKMAAVEVVYAKSFYAGAAHASGPLSGEFLGILGGETPSEVKSGIEAAVQLINEGPTFFAVDEAGDHAYFAHTISRTGTYLSKVAGINPGEPLAYLIAPPLEAMVGLDAALKAADVRICVFYGPPTETNFGGGLLTGSQSSCAAAAEAFAETVKKIALYPHSSF